MDIHALFASASYDGHFFYVPCASKMTLSVEAAPGVED